MAPRPRRQTPWPHFCGSWDDNEIGHITPVHAQTAFCHGLAGAVALGEAFADRVGAARDLGEHLRQVLTDRMGRTLLDGTVGAL